MTIAIFLLLLALAALLAWRQADLRAERALATRLIAHQPADPPRFEPAMVADLPEPARRYFTHAIAPGTPLLPVAVIEMEGELGLGTKDQPRMMPMVARQVLAAPHGFIWQVRAGHGALRVSGSDASEGVTRSWSRFRLAGLLPVARAGGSTDHALSAWGRAIAEAAIWTPAALLPCDGVTWEAPAPDTARVTVTHDGMTQAVDVTLAPDGTPRQVAFSRWTNANPEKRFRFQPFGGFLSDFREVSGYRIPMTVEAGNAFGTDAYFPFYKARVTGVSFPEAPPGHRSRASAAASGTSGSGSSR